MRPLRTGAGKPMTHVEFPPPRGLFKFRYQLFGCHARPRCKLTLIAPRHKQFYVCSADIDNENSSLHKRPPRKVFRADTNDRVQSSL